MKKFIGDRAFYRKLFAVMLPILVQNVITNLVGLLDNIMVGRLGTEQMSGVAIVNQLIFVFALCIFGGISGAGIFTTQYYGKGDDEGVRHTVRIKFYIVIAAVTLFALVFTFFGERLISFFLHEGKEKLDLEATLDFGKQYLAVMIWQMLPFAVMQIYSGTLRETGETVIPMVSGIAAIFVNLFLNWVLIFGKLGAPALGVRGAAYATLIARFVELGVVVIWAHTHKKRCPYIKGLYSSFRVPGSLLKNVAIKGTPLLVNEVLWSSGMTMLNQCYSRRGLEVVSAVNISSTVSNLFFCSFFAMGSTVAIIVGQLLGAGEHERAVREDRQLIAFSVFLCTLTGVVMAVLAPLIPRIYNTTAGVKALAAEILIVSACMMPMDAFTNASYFTLRSGGKTFITFLFDSGFVWSICVPAAFVLSRYTSVPILPMFIIVRCLDLIKCVIGYILIKKRAWVHDLTKDR
ncbi:MAG: MATE family efflux transporter [Clostridiales bacterium]|nr:MATE family efflux transporter [Clostridiales bacterium]